MLAATALLVLGGGALLWWKGASSAPTPAPEQPAAVGARDAEAAALPRPLRGARPSGALAQGADGHFVADADAVLFIEHFLVALGEEGLDAVRARIRRAVDERLGEPAAGEAQDFVDRYLEYRAALAAEFAQADFDAQAPLTRRLQWVREFRRGFFGAELAEALFGEEEDALRAHLARREAGADEARSEAERREELLVLEQGYPEPVRAARESASLPLRHARQERALRAAGADAAEIRALREEHFGPEGAERLERLDQERARWAARLGAYRSERDALLAAEPDPALALPRIEALRERHFPDPEEARRVALLDRVESLEPAAGP